MKRMTVSVSAKIWISLIIVVLVVSLSWTELRSKTSDLSIASDPVAFRSQELVLEKLVRAEGPEQAWKYLKQGHLTINHVSPGKINLHMLAHYIGTQFYEYRGEKGIFGCDDSFTNGCQHGFVTALLRSKGVNGMKYMNDICLQTSAVSECAHGVGHGIVEADGYDLPASLIFCDESFKNSASPCWEGAFMEFTRHIVDSGNDRMSSWYPCTDVPEKYRESCTASMPPYLNDKHRTTAEIGDFCMTADSTTTQTSCIGSLGFVIVRETNGAADAVLAECGKLAKEVSNVCLRSAVHLIAVAQYPDWERSVPLLCSRLTGREREDCRDVVSTR